MKKLLLTITAALALTAGAHAFTVPIGNYLNPGDTFVLSSNGSLLVSGYRLSVGTFSGTPNFADSASTLFSTWIPLNLNATVNFNDTGDGSVAQSPVSITSYGTQITIGNGTFTDAVRNAKIGNAYEFGDPDPDGDGGTPAEDPSFYNTIAGKNIYLWVSNVTTASNIATATTFSIFNTGASLEATGNVAFGATANYNAAAATTTRVKDGGIALIPEPSSLLLLLGAMGAGLLRRRRA